MGEKVNFIDTTTRDGSQSNWAAGMPVGMMDAVLEDIDKIGFTHLDCPFMPLQFKKITRDLKEDPWEMIKMFGKKAPNTIKGSMMPNALRAFDTGGNNREAVKLYTKLLVDYGALNRIQTLNHSNSTRPGSNWFTDHCKSMGVVFAYAVCYYMGTNRHTDEFFARKTREGAASDPEAIYLKDAGGLLDVESVRRVFTIMKENAGDIPLEIHGHCTTGLADAVYVEAMKQGCRTFHVGIPPLADGTAQPDLFNTVENALALGFEVDLDMERARSVAKRLRLMAKEEGLPDYYEHTRYKVAQYLHRVPGGVASNMRHQLKELHIEDRVDEVLEECVRICAETGEPHMITPYSQFVCTQAAINVALGERYKIVIDNFISYAMGYNGDESGYLDMDPNLRDKFVNLPRAAELKRIMDNRTIEQDMPLKELRNQYGAHLSDEAFLLRYIMKNEDEIEAMRKATVDHPFHTYACIESPILELIDDLSKRPKTTQVQVQLGDKSLLLKKEGA